MKGNNSAAFARVDVVCYNSIMFLRWILHLTGHVWSSSSQYCNFKPFTYLKGDDVIWRRLFLGTLRQCWTPRGRLLNLEVPQGQYGMSLTLTLSFMLKFSALSWAIKSLVLAVRLDQVFGLGLGIGLYDSTLPSASRTRLPLQLPTMLFYPKPSPIIFRKFICTVISTEKRGTINLEVFEASFIKNVSVTFHDACH